MPLTIKRRNELLSGYLKQYNIVHPIHKDRLMKMLSFHPRFTEDVIDLDIEHYMRNNCFVLVYKDGSRSRISYRQKTNRECENQCFRHLVWRQIVDFRKGNPEQCSICKIKTCDIHVDHVDKFRDLITKFKKAYNISGYLYVGECKDNEGKKFVDDKYNNLWKDFHKEHAVLRILCAKCNIKIR